ncbi:hypothetical protein V6N13_091339 [Hibiscus sabdariffa]
MDIPRILVPLWLRSLLIPKCARVGLTCANHKSSGDELSGPWMVDAEYIIKDPMHKNMQGNVSAQNRSSIIETCGKQVMTVDGVDKARGRGKTVASSLLVPVLHQRHENFKGTNGASSSKAASLVVSGNKVLGWIHTTESVVKWWRSGFLGGIGGS